MYKKEEVVKMIEAGEKMLLAADSRILADLPKGNWIGGSIPYFMGDEGGLATKEEIFVNKLSDYVSDIKVSLYGAGELASIPKDYPAEGVSFIIVPATSEAHIKFANEVSSYDGIFNSPLVGWISGVHLDDLGKDTPLVFDGTTGESSSDKAVVLHGSLKDGYHAEVDILNLFQQGSGDVLEFEEEGFAIKNVLVNGEKMNFAEYITKNGIDTQLPLVADYSGAMVNVSFQNVDSESGSVDLYAPVFKGVEYKIADKVDGYQKQFEKEASKYQNEPLFSCNCILNYLYAGLEGTKTGDIKGPITFGEIAYALLNQTMVYVDVKKS